MTTNVDAYEYLKQYGDVLTFKQLQEVLNLSRNKTYELLQTKQIKSIRIGSLYRIPKKYLADYLYKA